MKPKGLLAIPILLLILGALAVGLVAYVQLTGAGTRVTQPGACTLEAKICPDGSTVGRTGPSCEFAACPGTNGNIGASDATRTCATDDDCSLNSCSGCLAKTYLATSPVLPQCARYDPSYTCSCNSGICATVRGSANTNTSDPTAGWKTYSNASLGFSVTYPPTWKTASCADAVAVYLAPTPIECGAGLQAIGIKRETSDDSPEAFAQTQASVFSDAKTTPVTIDGSPGLLVTGTKLANPTTAGYGTGVKEAAYVRLGGSVWELSRTLVGSADVFASMLTTFHVTDPTAGWKTYTNTTYGYSIQYPSNWPLDSKNVAAMVIGEVPFEPGPGSLRVNVYPSKTVAQRLKELKANYIDGCTTETSVQVSGSVGSALQCRGAFAGEPHEFTLVARSSNTYELTYISGGTATDPTMKQILSTFRFTK